MIGYPTTVFGLHRSPNLIQMSYEARHIEGGR
jgi:hypothetical protein